MNTVEHKGKAYQIGGLYLGSNNCLIQLKEIRGEDFIGIDCSENDYRDNWIISIDQSSVFPEAKFGTITDAPIELIDGKAYQFDYTSQGSFAGIYTEDSNCFYGEVGYCYEITGCANIQLLVPEKG